MSAPQRSRRTVTLLIIFSPILAVLAFAAFTILMLASLPMIILAVVVGVAGHESLADEIIEYAPMFLIEKIRRGA